MATPTIVVDTSSTQHHAASSMNDHSESSHTSTRSRSSTTTTPSTAATETIDVAARLRQKIRMQAEELLNKVDRMSTPSPRVSMTQGAQTSSSASASFFADGEEKKDDNCNDDRTSTSSSSSQQSDTDEKEERRDPTSPTATTSTMSPSPSSMELTKRLQTLALDRQRECSKDRLRVIQADQASHLSSATTFQELDLPSHLLNAIFAMGFDRPSTIQAEALPRILAHRNLIGQAQSGSGKTVCFSLGMLSRLDTASKQTQAICVTPTRELAIQIVEKALRPLAKQMPDNLTIQLAVSGEYASKKAGPLQAQIVVGTPGKIVDWTKRRILDTSGVKVFVLDEADHMVAEGHRGHRANAVAIKKVLPKTTQCLFFSATFPTDVVTFATKIMGPDSHPDKILIEDGRPEFLMVDVIKQLWVDCRPYEGGKLEFLADIYSLLTIGQSIVFVATKAEADTVHETLENAGYTCSLLHGSVDMEDRDATMTAFRGGKANVLITTNVLARGVDVDNVCLVVNYDLPIDKDGNPDYATYLHRIGRTGRFGRKGTAINLVADDASIDVLADLERHFSGEGNNSSDSKEEKEDASVLIQQVEADPERLADVIEI